MKILITGADGYIGWPLFVSLIKRYPNYQIIGIDNLFRRKWVSEVKAKSAIKIETYSKKTKFVKSINKKNDFIKFDLTNFKKVDSLIKKKKFDIIYNLAAQPSAPYTLLSPHHTNFTQNNNNQILRNISWSLYLNKFKNTKLVHTTTTGTYGDPNFKIPEGFLSINNKKYLLGHMAGSWYHMSKCHDTSNMYLANRIWSQKIYDFRTAIVLGTSYADKEDKKIYNTRFDYDYYFGVVAHRFIKMALNGENLTIYGKGLQKKPFISLNDCVESLINFIKQKKIPNYMTYNQYSFLSSILDIANSIVKAGICAKKNVKNIKNPRVENETHQMRMENKEFLKILNKKPDSLQKIVFEIISDLKM